MSVYILLDRSQSMSTNNLWQEAVGSVNGYVANLPSDANVVLAIFDTLSYNVIRRCKVREWEPVSSTEYSPRGSTPLYDSAARMMWRALDDNDERSVFVVMTDGEENQSRKFTQTDVKQLISQLEAKKWEVIFLGANFDKISHVATGLGVTESKWMNIRGVNLSGTMTGLAENSSAYLSTGAAINFTSADKARAAS